MITDSRIEELLEAQLGFRPNKKTMETLEESDYLKDIRKGDPGAVEGAAEAVRELYEQIGQPLPRAEAPAMIQSNRKPRRLPLRVQAVSVLLAAEAAQDEEVVIFRRDVLHDNLLSDDQVEPWIKERDQKDGKPARWLRFPVPPTVRAEEILERKNVRLRFKPPLREISVPWGTEWDLIGYKMPDSESPHFLKISATGVLAELQRLSDRLAKNFTWQPVQATMFILTGAVPVVTMTRVQYHLREPAAASRITMTIDPVLSPAEVAARYEHARQSILEGRYREITEKHLQLALFMAARPASETLKTSMAAWNKRFTEWTYSQETNFGRDASKVRQRLLNPPVHPYPRRITE